MGIQRILAIVVSGGLLLLTLELVRRKRLMERYALLWLFSTLILLVLAVWNGLLTSIASALGISYPPSALFGVAFGVVLVLLVHFSLAVSRLSDQNKVLAQRMGILQRRVQEQHDRLERLDEQHGAGAGGREAQSPAHGSEHLTPTS
jgi:hypothetical protein